MDAELEALLGQLSTLQVRVGGGSAGTTEASRAALARGGVGADCGALVELGAERLQCPPGVFRAVMDDVRDAVDAAIFADDRSDSEHAARLDADAREVVLDSSFY